eukprot:137890_1
MMDQFDEDDLMDELDELDDLFDDDLHEEHDLYIIPKQYGINFNELKSVDKNMKQLVFGYIKQYIHVMSNKNNALCPQVIQWVILYYFSHMQSIGFYCVLCNNKHKIEHKFEWSICKHLYGQQCADYIIISCITENDVPKCLNCKQPLLTADAENFLSADELLLFRMSALQ